MKSITSDGSDDAVLPNSAIKISTQPASKTVASGATTFAVVAASEPAGVTLAYQWQISVSNGAWTNISNAGVYSTATTATLNISDVAGLNGNRYRAVITGSNVKTQNSNIAKLTVA